MNQTLFSQIQTRIRPGLAFALDLLIPPRCLVCTARVATAGSLCAGCWNAVHFVTSPCCKICGLPFAHDQAMVDLTCGACIADPPPYDRGRTATLYDAGVRGLILGLKHGDRQHVLPIFGRWMAEAGRPFLDEADFIVPVPLHWTRLLARRYNQSALLARAILATRRAQGRPCPRYAPDLMVRTRSTPSQGHRTPTDRAANVRGAFCVPNPDRLAGRHLVLVDDVMTSGATVRACSRILRRAGAARIDVITLARAVRTD